MLGRSSDEEAGCANVTPQLVPVTPLYILQILGIFASQPIGMAVSHLLDLVRAQEKRHASESSTVRHLSAGAKGGMKVCNTDAITG